MTRSRKLQLQSLLVIGLGGVALFSPRRVEAKTPDVCGPWCNDGCYAYDCGGCPSAPGTKCLEGACEFGWTLIYCVGNS
jgi:hypothetical protein